MNKLEKEGKEGEGEGEGERDREEKESITISTCKVFKQVLISLSAFSQSAISVDVVVIIPSFRQTYRSSH